MNKGRSVRFVILFFLVAALILLIQKNSIRTRNNHLSFAAGGKSKETCVEWFGIYLHKEKVGYSKTVTEQRGDGYEISEDSLMSLNTLGVSQRIESKLQSIVNADYSLRSFDFTLLSETSAYFLHGNVSGNSLDLVMVSGNNTTRSTVPIQGVPFLTNTITPYILKQGLKEGKKFCLPFFEPSTLCYSDITIDILGKENVLFSGKNFFVYKVQESFAGIKTVFFVTETGEIIKEEAPMGLTLVKEPQEQALSGDWMKKVKTDIAVSTAVEVAVPIANPRAVKFLKVRITNLPSQDFDLAEGRQKLAGDCLEINQEEATSWKTYTLPYPNNDLKPFLAPTPLMQSTDDRIISQAKRITGGERDAEKTARALLHWVYNTLQKKPTLSIPNALEVLEQKTGDCNEHTALFTALSRSLGMPARVCTGLVYLKDKFYYHAWPEIYLGRWVAIDPTFNQFPADAAHIRLVIGDLSNQLKMLSVVDKIKLEVVDFS